ncbi:hypothetical protein [Saccharopolyspora gloriosae]|uniref:hypothetical protein n=1 Tax=Saccharopolyspora gloriosae TaxID=455344 RepID=UPI001FB77B68|nr:hypothetical protein [Saccharopolyspora gloriosae]
MKIGRTCAAAAVLGTLAVPLTATVSWADTAAREDQRPGTNEEAQVSERQREAAEQQRAGRAEDGERADTTDATERRRQVSQQPAGAPDTGGAPAEWNATPAYAAGGTAAIAAAGAGTVLVLRRRRVTEQ